MSFNKPLPPQVFGEEPKYIAIRLDQPDLRGPVASTGLHTISSFPGSWTWMTVTEAVPRILREIEPSKEAEEIARLKVETAHLRSVISLTGVALLEMGDDLIRGGKEAQHA